MLEQEVLSILSWGCFSCIRNVSFINTIIKVSFINNWRKLLIKETLLIQEKQPQLNIDKTSTPLYLFNT